MKRSPLPPRTAPIKRASKPIRRTAKLKAKGGARFKGRADLPYRAHIRTLACLAASHPLHRCIGRVQACHVIPRSRGGYDHANLYPGCASLHTEEHAKGQAHVEARYALDLAASAARYRQRYAAEGAT